ncbi:cell wall hydrolase [Allosphingosinicella sp.]|jgi:spore germination cell wall hydrolase CwlJ-like protein|uniref:cell wall hydrolase n=1 Tax=Allosphingosinicella sp. TaxID=2823234 RepID=UPI002F1253CF
MFSTRKLVAGAFGALLLSATGFTLSAHAELLDAGTVPAPAPQPPAAPAPAVEAPKAPAAPSAVSQTPVQAAETAPRRTASAANAVDSELTCLAKVVVHEAGNQSRAGQLAVAQVVMNRVRSPRFPNTICAVVMQRGQFFNVHRYNPPRDARWRRALEVARDARNRISPPVVGNATFFHAAYAPAFRGRTRVARLGDHVFYR